MSGSGSRPGDSRPGDSRPGVRIGVDVGSVRVGVAASDPGGVLAVPVTTLVRDRRGNADIDQLVLIVRERQAVEVVVGLPRQMSGQEGRAVRLVRQYAEVLAERIAPVPVRFVDERLTTVAAHRRMAERGVRSRARRSLVDQEAAVQILQHDLDSRRGSAAPGVIGCAAPAAGPDGVVRAPRDGPRAPDGVVPPSDER
ncbi:Holliday junction DNA helicase RuvA [Frankia casuarinae]|uniref:Holliday junction resolvase RuvX n=1 Tax=Frankia casuarinae (strain DSM 45818 / CECT 9043 / HFP020203 / CcI3) TaxID=106370 RepID=UPI000A0F6EB1|nr:Holliday junction resolvase RuvX [Frankia casuarinae]ORT94350.1 Holliday junction DNA helicase RuvA [Frankia casuarinae]